MMNEWHIWAIVQQHYKNVEEFLAALPEVEEFVYPKVVREYNTKSGKKSRHIPLYSSYIFLKYLHNSDVVNKLSKCPWLKTYVGKCSLQEMEQVMEMSKRKYEDLIPTKEVRVGHRYKLIGSPFRGMYCSVQDISSDKLTVAVELFGSERLIKCYASDIELEG